MDEVFFDATGRRKEAVAKVRLRPGRGEVIVNDRPLMDHFGRQSLVVAVEQPLELTEMKGKYDVIAWVKGGGLSGQAGAIRLGITRALIQVNENLKKPLRKAGLLTRDPRAKERKKYGRAKRRKSFQYSKR